MAGKVVKTCRACGSKALSPAFSLGGDAVYVVCDTEKDPTGCGLLQRASDHVSENEPIAEAPSRTHRHRLRAAVAEAMEMISTRDGSALDIGCGDGTLMSFFPRWINAFGIEPTATDDDAEGPNGVVVSGQFPDQEVLDRLGSASGNRQFDVITLISVLGEQNNPGEILREVKGLLAPDGVAVIETPYASLALMRNNLGAFHKNAQAVYTLSILEAELRKAGMKIVRGSMTETEGGSLRLFATHADYTGHDYVPWLEQLARLWDEESVLSLSSRQTFQTFTQRIESNRQIAQSFFEEMRRYGDFAYVLGTSASMQSLLELYEITDDVAIFMVSRFEDNDSAGRPHVTINGQEIEVVAESDPRLELPDYFIADSSERREILENWRDAVFEGVKIIFLTPEFEIVDEENYGAELGKALAVTDGPGSVETLKAVLSTVRKPRLVAVNMAKEA